MPASQTLKLCPGVCNQQFHNLNLHFSKRPACWAVAQQHDKESSSIEIDEPQPEASFVQHQAVRSNSPPPEQNDDFGFFQPATPLHPSPPKRRRLDTEVSTSTPRNGVITEPHPDAGHTFGPCQTMWQEMKDAEPNPSQPHEPHWAGDGEWELARWLALKNLPMAAIDELLATAYLNERLPSFKTAQEHRESIENLPGGPRWMSCTITLPDAPAEPQILYYRDLLECVDYLIANPTFEDTITYIPCKEYDAVEVGPGAFEKGDRRFNEMWTADKWHEVQNVFYQADIHGVTIAPIILASDATHTSNFSGDRKVHPLYASIGNIDKGTRTKPSRRAFMVLAYMPVAKFTTIPNPKEPKQPQSRRGKQKPAQKKTNPMVGILRTRLLHLCLRHVTQPLRTQGCKPRWTNCSDHKRRKVFSFLAVHISDLQEQWELSCTRSCPQCDVSYEQFGSGKAGTLRKPASVMKVIKSIMLRFPCDGTYQFSLRMAEHGLLGVHEPYWDGLPFFEFGAFCSDMLHGLHKCFYDHTFSWCCNILGFTELDKRFKLLPQYPGFRSFKRGISHISQWSGKEHRDLERYALGALVGALPRDCTKAVRAELDFIYLAQYRSHNETTLRDLNSHNAAFHENKDGFIKAGGRVGKNGVINHFNIPKVHAKVHCVRNIERLGSPDGVDTEVAEHLHIIYAKNGVPLTNKGRTMDQQLVRWLDRCDKVHAWTAYIHWRRGNWPVDGVSDGSIEENAITTRPPSSAPSELTALSSSAADISSGSHHCLAVKPHHPRQHIRDLNNTLPGLIPAVSRYLSRDPNADPHTSRLPRGPVPTAAELPVNFLYMDCWDHMTITLPVLEAQHDPIEIRKIRAQSLVSKQPHPGNLYFDPVFVDVDPNNPVQHGIRGLRAAQVRLIFQPSFSIPAPRPRCLAFVEWFSLLTRHDETELYSLHRLRRADGMPQCDIIEVENIVRPCPLVPQMPRLADDLGGKDNAKNGSISWSDCLDKVEHFYINCFQCKPSYQSIF